MISTILLIAAALVFGYSYFKDRALINLGLTFFALSFLVAGVILK